MRDLVVFAALAVVLFALGWGTNAWQTLHDGLQDRVGGAADEIYGAITVAAVLFAGLSVRRSRQATRGAVSSRRSPVVACASRNHGP